MEVQKLYGVIHAIEIQYFHTSAHIALKPSKELLEELGNLPKGTSVGIEGDVSVSAVNVEEAEFITQDTEYWNDIISHCSQNGINFFSLEDMEVVREGCLQLLLMLRARENALNACSEDSRKLWERKAYEYQVNHDYIQEIERDRVFLGKIAELKPEIVVVGRGHADHFWSRPDVAGTYGIKFLNYACEIEPEMNMERLGPRMSIEFSEGFGCGGSELRSIIPQNRFLDTPQIDQNLIAQRISTERKYLSVKTGRITDNGRPDFIGTWDMELPAKGLFEVFIQWRQGNEISGTIEDTLGTAGFSGEMTEKEIYFSKGYKMPSSDCLSGRILFSGKKEGERFVGEWTHPERSGSHFEIHPFNV